MASTLLLLNTISSSLQYHRSNATSFLMPCRFYMLTPSSLQIYTGCNVTNLCRDLSLHFHVFLLILTIFLLYFSDTLVTLLALGLPIQE
jgi:hypothetical protein